MYLLEAFMFLYFIHPVLANNISGLLSDTALLSPDLFAC